MKIQTRFLLLVLTLYICPSVCVGNGGYVWENGKWVWKDTAESATPGIDDGQGGGYEGGPDDGEEGSADYYDDDYDYGAEGSGDDYHYGNYDDQRGGQSGGVPTGSNNDNSYPTNARDPYDNDPYKSNDDIDIIDDVTTTTTLAPTTQMTTTTAKEDVGSSNLHATSFFAQPGILTAVVGGAVVGLLCAILLVMFIVYRMRKKDEGSYALDEPRRSPNVHLYSKAPTREFFA